ncbi:hypothetical protein BGW80DRAFT_1251522 [Lactifluus volemus]|nr:hypothetical protein BGW80DRAFT_1251522 [Lactifluus volemus]
MKLPNAEQSTPRRVDRNCRPKSYLGCNTGRVNPGGWWVLHENQAFLVCLPHARLGGPERDAAKRWVATRRGHKVRTLKNERVAEGGWIGIVLSAVACASSVGRRVVKNERVVEGLG